MPITYLIYFFSVEAIEDYILDNFSKSKMAIIIDEKNGYGNIHRTYTHFYMFYEKGKSYKNDSHNEVLIVGDSIEIEYYDKYPKFNRPKKKAIKK